MCTKPDYQSNAFSHSFPSSDCTIQTDSLLSLSLTPSMILGLLSPVDKDRGALFFFALSAAVCVGVGGFLPLTTTLEVAVAAAGMTGEELGEEVVVSACSFLTTSMASADCVFCGRGGGLFRGIFGVFRGEFRIMSS